MRKPLPTGAPYGRIMTLVGALLLVPMAVLPFYPDEAGYAWAFLAPGLASMALGAIVSALGRRLGTGKARAHVQPPFLRGSLQLLFAWLFGFAVGAAPFVLGGQLDPVHALFESISGWTTTGLTVADIANMPAVFLFYRSFTQYCGGLGFILMIAAIAHGGQDAGAFNAEGHMDRLMPSIRRTARTIVLLYAGMLAAGTAMYALCGMNALDAVCHAMSALSTAGFGTRAESIGYYRSFAVEAVTVLLMLLGATNFAVLLLLVKRRFKQAFAVSEFRFMLAVTAVFTLAAGLCLWIKGNGGLWRSLWDALFGVVTTFSTTGYSTGDYWAWPPFALGLLLLLMFIGGGSGSTAGGLKLSRVNLLLIITRKHVREKFSTSRAVAVPHYRKPQGKVAVDEALAADTMGFVAVYLVTAVAGTLLLTLFESRPLMDAFFEFTSALGTVGLSNGLTAAAGGPALAVLMAGMVLGRLEIYIVFLGLYSAAQRVRRGRER